MYGFPLLQSKSSSIAEYFFFFFFDLLLLVLFRGDRLSLVAADGWDELSLERQTKLSTDFTFEIPLTFLDFPLYSVPREMPSPPFS